MKIAVLVGGLALTVAGVASADVKLNFGSGTYGAGASTTIKLTDLAGTLTGFSAEFDYVTNANGSWASDAAFVCNGVQTGGYDMYLASATTFNAYWGFDGSGSAASGHYSDVKALADSFTYGTSYTFEWGNAYSFSSDVEYNNVTVTLFGVNQVPAPGAVALLGLAGLVGRRRRA